MKRLLKVILIIVAIVAIVLAIAAVAAAALAAPAAATGTSVGASIGSAVGTGALTGTTAFIGGSTFATANLAFAGALTPMFTALGFTSLSGIVMVMGGIAAAAFLTYDLAFKGGKTINDVTSAAVKAVKNVWHKATDGLIKPGQKKLKSFGFGFKIVFWILIVCTIGYAFLKLKESRT